MKTVDLTSKPKNPFRVPDDYFQNFNARIMEQLPEKKVAEQCVSISTSSKTKHRKMWIYGLSHTGIAAAICGIVFGVTLLQNKEEKTGETAMAIENSLAANMNEEYLDDVCDYAMIGTDDVFACTTRNE